VFQRICSPEDLTIAGLHLIKLINDFRCKSRAIGGEWRISPIGLMTTQANAMLFEEV
jgi:hypothetical protein